MFAWPTIQSLKTLNYMNEANEAMNTMNLSHYIYICLTSSGPDPSCSSNGLRLRPRSSLHWPLGVRKRNPLAIDDAGCFLGLVGGYIGRAAWQSEDMTNDAQVFVNVWVAGKCHIQSQVLE